MAATSAGHQTLQQQQQNTNTVVQQKANNLNPTFNNAMNRNVQQTPQVHSLQQQQQLMQQYAMKQQQQHQQQSNFTLQPNMQPQQQSYIMQQQQSQSTTSSYHHITSPQPMHQNQQQMQLKLQQQQQQLLQNQNSQFASNMMPCQNFMTPLPQLHTQPTNRINLTSGNNTSSNGINVTNTISWTPQYQNFQYGRKTMPIVANKTINPASPRSTVKQSHVGPAQSNSSNTNVVNNSQTLQQHQNGQQQQLAIAAKSPKENGATAIQQKSLEQKTNVTKSHGFVVNTRQPDVASTKSNVATSNISNIGTKVLKDSQNNLPKTVLTNGLNTKSEDNGQDAVKANLPPGWRRNTNNNEIVYISPTGVTLRSPFQIKDYLLSSGTCKCGLPCPLQPDCIFNFNVQVPNTPLTAASATVYQNNNNGFNNSSSSVKHQQTSMSGSLAISTIASASSSSLPASSSTTALSSSVPNILASSTTSMVTATVPSGTTVPTTSLTADTATTTTTMSTTTTIPSATPSSSLTCLHQRRFLDCQQLHAQPTELFNKDNKRRKIANTESSTSSLIDSNLLDVISPATTDSESMFSTNSSIMDVGGRQCTSQNNRMMSGCNIEEEEQQQHHSHHHHQQQEQQQQQRPQPVITNCYNNTNNNNNNNSNNNNNIMMENTNKTWPKHDDITMTHESSATHHHHLHNDSGCTQWSNLNAKPMSQQNMCPHHHHQQHQQQQHHHHHHQNNSHHHQQQHQNHHRDHHPHHHHHQQGEQQQQHHCSEFHSNTQEQQNQSSSCLYKDDLNGYLQHQTELVHNSMMDVVQQRQHNQNQHHLHHHHQYDNNPVSGYNQAVDNTEEEEEEGDDEEAENDEGDEEEEEELEAEGEDEEDAAGEEEEEVENDEEEDEEEEDMDDDNEEEEEVRQYPHIEYPPEQERIHDQEQNTEAMDTSKPTDHTLDFLHREMCMGHRLGEEHQNCNEEEGDENQPLDDTIAANEGNVTESMSESFPAMETSTRTTRLLNNQTANTSTQFYQIPPNNISEPEEVRPAVCSNLPRLAAITQKLISYELKVSQHQGQGQTSMSQHNLLMPNGQAKPMTTTIKLVPTAQESPVSSSTVHTSRSTPDLQRTTSLEGNKKPEQVGAISTSNESPRPYTPSPVATMDATKTLHAPAATSASAKTSTVPSPMPSPMSHSSRPQQIKHQMQQTKPPTASQKVSSNQPVRIVRQIKTVQQTPSQQQVSQQQRILSNNTARNTTLTTMAGNRGAATTTTTTASSSSSTGQRNMPHVNSSLGMTQKLQTTMQKLATANAANTNGTSISLGQLQLQPLLRAANENNGGNSQIIMTSTGQIIVMPSSNNKANLQTLQQQQQPQTQQQQQVIIASGNATATTQTAPTTNLIIQQADVLNNSTQLTATLQQQPNGGYIVSQPASTNTAAPQLQPTTVILNSGQNLLASNGAKVLTNAGNTILHAAGTQSILTAGNQLITTATQPTANGNNVLGQQTVVLNALPNGGGYVIQQQPQHPGNTASTQQQQQQFATLDSQVVQQIVQQADGTTLIQHQQQPQRIIIASSGGNGDHLKRRTKKRKNSPGPSPATAAAQATINQISNQTTTLLQQHAANIQAAAAAAVQQHNQVSAPQQTQVVQLTTAGHTSTPTSANSFPQQFQLGSTGIQGIVVSKPATTATTANAQPQQIILQNGQIIQPMNLLGQQLILPTTGLVMGPDSTLLQIQNVGAPTANILTATTPQATMMLRATSPQTNKSFISSTATGQQFIVGSNGQLSPIGQIYSTPMGLVMPTAATTQHTTTPTATFVQHNGTIQVQQQQPGTTTHQLSATTTQHHVTLQTLQQHQQNLNHVVSQQPSVGIVLETATSSTTTSSPNVQQAVASSRSSAASPPDTTTHSPRSPERPPSHRSGGSDMVQCVSSSEPDGGTVSPMSTDSRQSPSTTVCDKGIVMSTAYQQSTSVYKPSEAKIRRVQTPPQYQVIGGGNGAATATAVASTTNIGAITNLTLHQHTASNHNSQQQQQQAIQQKHMEATAIKPADTHVLFYHRFTTEFSHYNGYANTATTENPNPITATAATIPTAAAALATTPTTTAATLLSKLFNDFRFRATTELPYTPENT
ncbi:six-banded isoform X3 [Haematobia irritans]|uniref:six-banded isoform X3 n=1 Tax=Haematobia irritans TaxID=7368 RepID=UPI003F500521